MTASALNLFLVDEDPVFRMGLRIWLEQRPEFTIVGEASSSETALTDLENLQTAAVESRTDAGAGTAAPTVDLVILDLGLGQGDPEQLSGLQLCAAIKQRYPQLAVLVLSAHGEPVLREAANQMGADGFGQRGLPVQELVKLIHHTALRQPERLADSAADVVLPQRPEGPVGYLNRTSLEQIDAAMAEIEMLAAQRLPYWYRLVLAGKYRELRAARWLVQRILPVPAPPESAAARLRTGNDRSPNTREPLTAAPGDLSIAATVPSLAPERALVNRASPMPVLVGDVRSRVSEAVFRKLQFSFENRSDIPLEIDILRSEKARELLYTILRTLETLLDDLQQAQVQPGQLVETTPVFLRDLWESVMVDFFGRYYAPAVDGLERPMVTVLQQDAAIVQTEILNRIPAVPVLLGHLLFQTPLEIDGASYVATTPEALRRSQFLLENLLIQVGCAVMQPVLNHYPDVESLKRSLYQRRIISTRDITRFRNDLSWRYRWDTLVNEPKAIFESEYRLFALTPDGIRTHHIYAPRRDELESLSGLQYVMTLALEARDAIAPRLRATLSLAGSSVVFVLTEVIGRGIGLIGRGIVKGVGSTWQEIRFRQSRRDEM
jgi:DNA-binding NarL/FixJ family response regulator